MRIALRIACLSRRWKKILQRPRSICSVLGAAWLTRYLHAKYASDEGAHAGWGALPHTPPLATR